MMYNDKEDELGRCERDGLLVNESELNSVMIDGLEEVWCNGCMPMPDELFTVGAHTYVGKRRRDG